MKLPLKWLKDYVDYNVTHKEFALKMLLRGFETSAKIINSRRMGWQRK